MKSPIKLIASALIITLSVLTSLPGLSQDTYYSEKTFAAVMYPALADSKLWLCLDQYKPEEKVSLQLIDQKGKVLFTELLPGKSRKQNTYRQQFDMSQLNDGSYTFRLSAASHQEEFTFHLSTPSLTQAQPARLIAIN